MIWNYSNLNLWIVIFGVVQIVTAFYGIKFIKILNIFSSPCLLIMGFILIYFMRTGSNTTLGQVLMMKGNGTGSLAGATMAFIGGYATLACSIQDIVKDFDVPDGDKTNWPKLNKVGLWYVCWLPGKGVDTMPKKRANGEGSIRKRKDGRWEGRYTAGCDPTTGKPIHKSVLAKTQSEAKEKLKQAIAEAEKLDMSHAKSYTLGAWIKLWYEVYAEPRLREKTKDYYLNYIDNHIVPELGNTPLEKLTTIQIQNSTTTCKNPDASNGIPTSS